MTLLQRVRREFARIHAGEPEQVARAPGRVNLIGEHTDYNDGYVLPMAIDRAVWIAFRPRLEPRVSLYSLDYEELAEIDLHHLSHDTPRWMGYVAGVAWAMQEAGFHLEGWDGVVVGDVPIGAGLSSSAALELAAAQAFATTSSIAWDAARMARLCQRAENEWMKVECGIMDQLTAASGVSGHALLIDCRSLEIETVALPPGLSVIVLDTNTRRGLVESAYNERRRQCEQAARFFGVPALRDVNEDLFAARSPELDSTTRKRARHVITENERTLQAVAALNRQRLERLGALMNASHASLRDDFEVSSRELDQMAACARGLDACYGARMTGAGFGGCAVALVQSDKADDFARRTAVCYENASGLRPEVYICQAAQGAALVDY